MHLCHGKRRCTITADTTTFGNPCRADSRMYLKTVYTCGKYIYIAMYITQIYVYNTRIHS